MCEDGICNCSIGWTGADCLTDTCPEHCSNHGSCSAGECSCSLGWIGLSCATALKPLAQLAPLPTVAEPKVLAINELTVVVRIPRNISRSEKMMTANVTLTTDLDCVEALQLNRKLFSKTRHIPTNQPGDLVIENAPQACCYVTLVIKYTNKRYYTGDFPPLTPSPLELFNFGEEVPPPVANKTACYNDCSGHGKCTEEGQCLCDEGWFGPCCCKAEVDPSSMPKQVDPLENEPGYPPFGGPPTETPAPTVGPVEQELMQDSRFFQPPYEGSDVLLETGVWTEAEFGCCRG